MLDLENVKRINSLGIGKLHQALDGHPVKLALANVPIPMVAMLNMSDDMIPDNITIMSFYAPVYDTRTDATHRLNLRVGQDVPLLRDYADFDIAAVLKLPAEMEIAATSRKRLLKIAELAGFVKFGAEIHVQD